MKKEELTLLIMAAGMGSRFGGLKQIEPFGAHGEFLIDYSIYDAIQVGFTKVVFIIKEENFRDFKETIGRRVESLIDVEYVFQKIDHIPNGFVAPRNRVKPWGTAHAIYCAKDVIHDNFAVINADDFYGRDAFTKIAEFLQNNPRDLGKECYGLVGYRVQNTLTKNGAVKRGVCQTVDCSLQSMIESNVILESGKIIATPLDGRDCFEVTEGDFVSMNMFGFTPSIFSYIEGKMKTFFRDHQTLLDSCEFLIPDVVADAIDEGKATVKVLPTESRWMGVTYKEDKEFVVLGLQDLIKKGEYPEQLWKS